MSAARWNSPPPVYDAHTRHAGSALTPYLQLPHLLSLTWLAYPILSLLFIVFRLQLSADSANNAVASAKENLLASCKAAERAATATASMPRYLAAASNQQITDAVNGTMNAARATLILALTIMEAIINFVIDIYRSTFLCFLELIVRGALSILIAAVQEFNSFVTNTLNGLRTSIQNDVSKANDVIKSAVDAINKVNPFGDISVPQFDIPSLSGLQNVQLPTDFQDALTKLNSSLPSIAELKDKVESIIDKPFELLKKDINETFAGIDFDVNALPVPAQNNVLFCDQMDTSVVDDLGRDIVKMVKIGTIIMVVLIVLLIAANCALEWYKWRAMKQTMQRTREAWSMDTTVTTVTYAKSGAPTVELSDHNLMCLQATAAHPLLMKIANKVSLLLHLSPSQYGNLQWFLHYVFHAPALACFLIGFFGLISVQLQLFAIGPIAHHYAERSASSVSDFSSLIATSVNDSMYNQSAVYASDINGRVDRVQSAINDGMLGWVNGTTTTLNDTINTFYTDIQNVVDSVFKGTILEQPVQEFVRCFIGSKVDAIENALTFLHDNLHVDVPRVNNSVLVLSQADVDEATRPIALAAIGDGNDGDSGGLVGRIIAIYVESLKKERIMFAIFLGLWGVVVLMALAVILWHAYGRAMVEAHRRRKFQRTQRVGIDGITIRGRSGYDAAGANEKGRSMADLEKPPVDLPSFTPLPSPKKSPRAERHPLSMRRPAYQQSWDSFLDQANTVQSTEPRRRPTISAPRKLMAIGRKALGREPELVADTTSTPISRAPHGQADGQPWMTRMTGMFWKKDLPAPPASGSQRSSVRHRPNLSISTAHTLVPRDDLPVIEQTSPTDSRGPTSAWSVSPGPPPKFPWISSIAPTRKSTVGPPAPRQTSRRTASVPTDVTSTYEPTAVVVAAPPQNPGPMPLHHGFVFPAPSPQYLMPPPVHPASRKASIVDPDTSTPVTRHLAAHHARKSSQAVDPFVTPFDDEHARPVSTVTPTARNPFADPARRSVPMGNASTNPFFAL